MEAKIYVTKVENTISQKCVRTMQLIKVAWFIDQLETYVKNDSSRFWNSTARFKGIMKFHITKHPIVMIAVWKTDNYSKIAESWCENTFADAD